MSEHHKFSVPEELFPFEHRYRVLSSGERIHYVDEGTGQVLLMLHGNPSWSFIYRKLISLLRRSFRCIALDYPGFGLSEAGNGFGFTPAEQSLVVESFVQALDLREITIVVQDWGGPIGLGFAGRRPDLIKRIVLGNTFAWPLIEDKRIRLFSAAMGGPLGRAAAYWFNGIVRLFIREGIHTPVTALEKRMFLAPFESRHNRWLTAFMPGQLIHAHEYLSQVNAGLSALRDRPTLFVWGIKDFAFQESYRRRFEQVFPNHTIKLLENASHFWQYDAAEAVAETVQSWLSDYNPTSST